MADPDIVTRLRESDGGFFMRQMFTESADEIERLRAERDEARQEICESHCDSLGVVLGSHITPQDYAQRRGWDCYKENTNA